MRAEGRRHNRVAPMLLLLLLTATLIYICKGRIDYEKPVIREFTDLSADEAERATADELQVAIASRALTNADYRKISQNFDAYPRELLELCLRNHETAPFVAGYLDALGEEYIAETIDVRGDLAGTRTPYFLQWDTRWGYADYGGEMMALSGCGPTCLSMAAAGLTGDSAINPLAIADYSEAQGWYYPGQGTGWELMRQGAEHFGLNWRELSLDETRVQTALDGGSLVIVSVGPGDFTTTGHYILLTGYNEDGFSVQDPNSRENSAFRWSFSRLAPQIQNLWAYDAAG